MTYVWLPIAAIVVVYLFRCIRMVVFDPDNFEGNSEVERFIGWCVYIALWVWGIISLCYVGHVIVTDH